MMKKNKEWGWDEQLKFNTYVLKNLKINNESLDCLLELIQKQREVIEDLEKQISLLEERNGSQG